jgi:hypothetical protein
VRSEKVDIEELASTKSEKILALVLGVFVQIGAIWAYTRITRSRAVSGSCCWRSLFSPPGSGCSRHFGAGDRAISHSPSA